MKIFNNVLEAIKHISPDNRIFVAINQGGVLPDRIVLKDKPISNGQFVRTVGDKGNLFLRGENSLYKSCKSSLYRIEDRNKRIFELLKTYEFINFINSTKVVKKWESRNYYFDSWATAQHYGFCTPMIDLTHDIITAAFFATHRYNSKTLSYSPILEGEGQLRYLLVDTQETSNKLAVIGVQPFSRPFVQYGYGFWLKEDEDLADLTKTITFKQGLESIEKLYTATGMDQDTFFPDERLIDLANFIKCNNVITKEAILSILDEGTNYIPNLTIKEIENVINKFNIYISDAPIAIGGMLDSFVERPINKRYLVVKKPRFDIKDNKNKAHHSIKGSNK